MPLVEANDFIEWKSLAVTALDGPPGVLAAQDLKDRAGLGQHQNWGDQDREQRLDAGAQQKPSQLTSRGVTTNKSRHDAKDLGQQDNSDGAQEQVQGLGRIYHRPQRKQGLLVVKIDRQRIG